MGFFRAKPEETKISVETYLSKHRIGKDALRIQEIDGETVQSTDAFLAEKGVGKMALTADEVRRVELRHRLSARMTILWSLVVPMSIVPLWLMVLLSLPAFGNQAYKGPMQGLFLTALVSDFAGLYFVVTRDLFPHGNDSGKRKKPADKDTESEKSDEDE